MASARPAWWLTVDGQSYGPYDLRTMQGYIAEGRVTGESIVCRVGDQTWAPARGDTLLFRSGTPAAPPYPGGGGGGPTRGPGAAAQATAAPEPQWSAAPAEAAPASSSSTKRIIVAVLGAALVGLFFAPWVDAMFMQMSGYGIVRFVQALQSGGGFPGLPGMQGVPGLPPGQAMPRVQVDLGWRAYQVYLLVLIPVAGAATFAAALAGLRIWRLAAITCGVVVWGLIVAGMVDGSSHIDLSHFSWSNFRDSLQYVGFGAYGTLVVATVLTGFGFTRA
jgi:hypothetical protein